MDFPTMAAFNKPGMRRPLISSGLWCMACATVLVSPGCTEPQGGVEEEAAIGGESHGVRYARHFSFSADFDTLWTHNADVPAMAWVHGNPGAGSALEGARTTGFVGDPVRLATWSTTHVPHVMAIGAEDAWCASGYVDRLDLDVHGEVGHVRNLGGDGGLDEEMLLVSGATVLTSYPFGDPMQGVQARTGVRVIPLREYEEQHPLGRAEYIKVFGWLTGRLEQANAIFEGIAARYDSVGRSGRDKAEALGRPTVFTGSEQGGTWTAPGGEGLVARLVEDAGGHYAIDDSLESAMALVRDGGNVLMDMEQFALIADASDCWGKVVYAPEGWFREDAQNAMPWLDMEGKLLFHCNTAEVDYFGQASLEPDRMLQDLVAIFHGGSGADGAYFLKTPPRP